MIKHLFRFNIGGVVETAIVLFRQAAFDGKSFSVKMQRSVVTTISGRVLPTGMSTCIKNR